MFVIDSRTAGHGEFIRRRLKCGECDARFTSHEIREGDLADNSVVHFSQILERIRAVPRENKRKQVFVSQKWYQKILPCCFERRKDVVNH